MLGSDRSKADGGRFVKVVVVDPRATGTGVCRGGYAWGCWASAFWACSDGEGETDPGPSLANKGDGPGPIG